jgi:lipoprotein-releasing system ATP-binding protein
MTEILLQAKNLVKTYPQGAGELLILNGVNLDLHEAESVCIVGASGSGKSTLLHILGTLDRPNSGELRIRGKDVLTLEDDELSRYRNEQMGFVFQFHHLLAEFTALENTSIPLRIGGVSKSEATDRAVEFLVRVGLRDRMTHYPSQLSGGELQRVAIARSLICHPKLLLADEPTGNLDSKNSQAIQELFFELKSHFNLTLLVVTHDASFAKKFSRVMRISDGQWVRG